MARASACECAYLLELSVRLRYLPAEAQQAACRYEGLSVALFAAMTRIRSIADND